MSLPNSTANGLMNGQSNDGLALAHHLSKEARNRLHNPMKSIWKKAFGIPGMIS